MKAFGMGGIYKNIRWPESANERSIAALSAKLVPRGQRDGPYGRILDFLDLSRYCFFQVAPHCTNEAEWTPFQHQYSQKMISAGNRTRTFGSVVRNSDH
jgi:hypothetical protein